MMLSSQVYLQARDLIASRLGLDFPEARQFDLEQGLLRALRAFPFDVPEAYLTWLATLPEDEPEWRRLAGHLTVGETYFFRDRAGFEALEHEVLPALIAARRAAGMLRLRLWSAGCATGEEPYSLAILLDRLLSDRADWALTIMATDINLEALEAAKRGPYRAWALRETPPPIRDRYFRRRGAETFELEPAIRRMVTFAPLNLAKGNYPTPITNTGAMDLILCRNVLMYLTRKVQMAIVSRLRGALVPGGWLVVSAAEGSADLCHALTPVNFPGAIFYRKEAAGDQGIGVGDWGMGTDSRSLVSGPESLVPASLESGIKGHRSGGPLHEAEELGLDAAGEYDEQRPTPIPQPPLLDRARALADQGHLEQARDLCQAALAEDKLDAEAHLLLAAVCQEQGDVPAAQEALRRVIYLDPDSASAHFMMGSLLARQGEKSWARRYLTTAVRLLRSVPHNEPVRGAEGLTAGRLLETAGMCLEMVDNERRGSGVESSLSFPVVKGGR